MERFYVDGQPYAQRALGGLTFAPQRLSLGAHAWAAGDYFRASWTRCASGHLPVQTTQIAAGYDRALGAEQPGLVVSYSFDDGAGQWAANLTAYNHDARLGTSNVVDPADPAWVPSTAPLH